MHGVVETAGPAPSAEIDAEAEAIGAAVWAHALDIDSGSEVGRAPDELVAMASVFKVPVLVEYARQVAVGTLDPLARVTVQPGRTPGPTGLSVFADATEWSVRDLATSMITVSDNTATDVICGLVGVEQVNTTLRALGLSATTVPGDCATQLDTIRTDLGLPAGTTFGEVERRLAERPERFTTLSVCTPASTWRTTPREATRLLQLVWTDRVGPASAGEIVRQIMGMQVWPHRLGSGFPDDAVRISGKTGTLGVVRNEIGVVEYPDGGRFAVAVFVRTRRAAVRDPAADRLIGTVARLLVDQLRLGTRAPSLG